VSIKSHRLEQLLELGFCDLLNDGLYTLAWQYNFEGRADLVKFVKTVAAAGLYVHLRIGPYACAEWNYG